MGYGILFTFRDTGSYAILEYSTELTALKTLYLIKGNVQDYNNGLIDQNGYDREFRRCCLNADKYFTEIDLSDLVEDRYGDTILLNSVALII